MMNKIQMLWTSLFIFIPVVFCEEENATIPRVQIAGFNWESIEKPYTISLWLIIAALAKIVFKTMKPISNVFPESSLLIFNGLVCFLVFFEFSPGYFMPNRALFENLDSVLLFSVFGTVWNTFAIGGSLLLLSYLNLFTMEFSGFEIFVFSALISAVDPVAVIAVFEEINVNEFLFINVFGEALFNDGVTVVLYHMFKSFTLIGEENVRLSDYSLSCLSFFVVTLGGLAIGLVFAFLTAWITKYTSSVRILAPVFIFVLPYMAYLTAEMTSLSSIIAIAVCGMVMKQYVKENISTAAVHSVKYFTKMLAQSSETVIFIFLGLSTISSRHYWDSWFVISTIVFCLVWRTLGVLAQCWFLNRLRKKKFTKVDQFVLSYGGLRGAIAFGLAVSMPASIVAKEMFVTTTIVVIFFTVFLQGITIRPLVQYLNVETKDNRAPTMAEIIYNKYLDYMMSGVEDIAGVKGAYTFLENFDRFNAKILRPILLRDEQTRPFDASTIVRAYAKITLEDALSMTRPETEIHERPRKTSHSRTSEGDGDGDYPTNKKQFTQREKKLQRFMENGQNMENLYSLFSDLLDRKLKEMDNKHELNGRDDICDDYMKQLNSNANSFVNLRKLGEDPSTASFGKTLDPNFARHCRRQSTGNIKMKPNFFV